jgi:hypothetical protein
MRKTMEQWSAQSDNQREEEAMMDNDAATTTLREDKDWRLCCRCRNYY